MVVVCCVAYSIALALSATTAPSAQLGREPLRFEENCGQHPPEVRFAAHAGDVALWLTPGRALLEFGGDGARDLLVMELGPGSRLRHVDGAEPLPGVTSVLRGSDPSA